MSNSPVFVSSRMPGIGTPGPITAHGGRIYLGRRYSADPARANVLVLTPDSTGRVTTSPDCYPDSEISLPTGARSSVTALHVDPGRRRLYVGTGLDYGAWKNPPTVVERRALAVHHLDDSGLPTGPVRSFDIGAAHGSVLGIALHPTLDLMYLVGWGDPQVVVFRLVDGEPSEIVATVPVGNTGKCTIALNADASLMYLGAGPDTLEICPVGPDGIPSRAARRFPAGLAPGATAPSYFGFHHTEKCLYRINPAMLTAAIGAPVWPVVRWPLDPATGNPVGTPITNSARTARGLAVGADKQLWLARDATVPDAFTGATAWCGTEVVSAAEDGGAPEVVSASYGEEALTMTVTADGTPVVVTTPRLLDEADQVKGNHVRVTITELEPPASGEVAVTLARGVGGALVRGKATVGAPVVLPLDPVLKGEAGDRAVFFGVAGTVTRMSARIEVFDGDPAAGGTLRKDLRDTVSGGSLGFVIPGYGFVEPGTRFDRVELLSTRAERYAARADAVAVPPADRPQVFPLGCNHLMGGQAHLGQLRAEAHAVTALGANTAIPLYWNGLPAAELDAELDKAGLTRRGIAVYSPLAGKTNTDGTVHTPPLVYFDFYLEKYRDDLAKWASDLATQAAGTAEATVDLKLADEPAWYYPAVSRPVAANPEYLAAFHQYLIAAGLTPAFFGAGDWSAVLPVTGAQQGSLELRRRYYWTARFFADQASAGFKRATAAVEEAFNHAMTVDVNWNNDLDTWYAAAPNAQVGNNPDTGPDAGMGFESWFTAGATSAHTLWTEDWFPDREAQRWSVRADALRSASAAGTRGFGAYLTGFSTGGHPAGAAYKALSLVGKGAKALDCYTFGPNLLFGNGWSDHAPAYAAFADMATVLGRAEHLLYPGVPAGGQVALLTTPTSHLWDADPLAKLYQEEVTSLHVALTHAGYRVDFVDEHGAAAGVLGEKGYHALYVTGPNVSAAASSAIADWVRGGGLLAVTAGAGVADEYNEPVGVLDEVIGLRARAADRTVSGTATPRFDRTVVFTDPAFGNAPMALRGPVSALEPRDGNAAVVATADAHPVITKHAYGAGVAVAYGFFPGYQYWFSPDQAIGVAPVWPDRLPARWGAAQRTLATAPAIMAGTPRPVAVSRELVEACRLDSAAGVAIVLLNWSDDPIAELEVTTTVTQLVVRAASARGVPVALTRHGHQLTARMPLQHNDVLLLESQPHR